MSIENCSFIDALYMTVITVSTVGFKEVHDLSGPGKIFTIFLIISSLGTFAYAVSIITTKFVEGQFSFYIKGYINKSAIKNMKNHVIICGYGRNGKQTVKELIALKLHFLIIEKDHELIINNSDKNLNFIEGDATDDEVLKKAGIKNAKALISTLPDDADNLFVVLTAHSLNKDLTIISRAKNDSSDKKLRIAGADNIVMPEKIGGAHMAKLVARPDIVEFLEHLSVHSDAPTNLEEIVCSNLPRNLINHSISEIGIRAKSGANIVGFKTPKEEFILNPSPETIIMPDSKLFVLGTPEQIKSMKNILNS